MDNFKKIFSYLYSPEPPEYLFEKIRDDIKREEARFLRKRIFFFSAGLGISSAVFVYAFRMAWSGFIESGFFSYAALLFSDAPVVFLYWKNFLFSVLETLPVSEIAAVSATALIFLELLKLLIGDVHSYIIKKSRGAYTCQ